MEKYLSLNLWTIRVIGIWQKEKVSRLELKMKIILQCLTVGSILYILIPAAAILAFSHIRRYDLSKNAEILALLISSAIIFVKILNIIVRKEGVNFLLNKMSEFWQNSTTNEKTAMHDYAMLGKNVTKLYLILGFFSIVSFMLQPFFHSNSHYKNNYGNSSNLIIVNRLPFDGWDDFLANYSKSITIFVIVYASHVITGIIATSASIGHDCFFVVLILHVCANLKSISSNLMRVSHYIEEENDAETTIINCGKKLRDLIEYTKELENMLSLFLLAQILSSTLIICLTSFLVSRPKDMNSNEDLFKYISFWAAALFQIFIFCWAANHLQTETHIVGLSAYDVYGKLLNVNSSQDFILRHCHLNKKKIQQYLQMIIMRSQKPPIITAGNFYNVSLENYKNILSTSYSYFTILRAFAVDNEIKN